MTTGEPSPPYRGVIRRTEETHTNGRATHTHGSLHRARALPAAPLIAGVLLAGLLCTLLAAGSASAARTIYCLKKTGHHVVLTKCPKPAAGPRGVTGAAGTAGAAGQAAVAGVAGVAGANGPLGAPGAGGLTGATGPTGPTGAGGATGNTGVVGTPEVVEEPPTVIPVTGQPVLKRGETTSSSATCAPSQVLLGGGGVVEPSGGGLGSLEASYPSGKEWKVTAIVSETSAEGAKLKLTAYAICAEP